MSPAVGEASRAQEGHKQCNQVHPSSHVLVRLWRSPDLGMGKGGLVRAPKSLQGASVRKMGRLHTSRSEVRLSSVTVAPLLRGDFNLEYVHNVFQTIPRCVPHTGSLVLFFHRDV